jgi:hypothetical protein
MEVCECLDQDRLVVEAPDAEPGEDGEDAPPYL